MQSAMAGIARPAMEPGDSGLVHRCARGDEAAAAALYQAYADRVFRFVYRRVTESREDAEEITNDVFVAAVSCSGTFNSTCTVFTWLCGIAKLRIADWHRRQGRRKRVPARLIVPLERLRGEADPGEPASSSVPQRLEAARLVDRLLGGLREEEREVLLLRYVEEFSIREISLLTSRSEKGVESLLMRAKKRAVRMAARGAEP